MKLYCHFTFHQSQSAPFQGETEITTVTLACRQSQFFADLFFFEKYNFCLKAQAKRKRKSYKNTPMQCTVLVSVEKKLLKYSIIPYPKNT